LNTGRELDLVANKTTSSINARDRIYCYRHEAALSKEGQSSWIHSLAASRELDHSNRYSSLGSG
jgi:hypothetical protein